MTMTCIRCGFTADDTPMRAHNCYEHDRHVSALARQPEGWHHLYAPKGYTILTHTQNHLSVMGHVAALDGEGCTCGGVGSGCSCGIELIP